MKLKLPIKAKAVIMITLYAMILGAVSLVICGRMMSNTVDKQYRKNAESVSATVAKVIDEEKFARLKEKVRTIYESAENKVNSEEKSENPSGFQEYISLYSDIENDEDFIELRGYLREIQRVNNVDCIFLIFVDTPAECAVYVVDADEENACRPGCIDPIYDNSRDVLTDPSVGFPSYITNTDEYGWLVTAGAPVYDGDGGIIGYAMTDISLNDMKQAQLFNITELIIYLLLATVLLIIITVLMIDLMIIKPIKKLTVSAAGYYADDSLTEHNDFAKLKINTGDEITTLANSMKKMESDLNTHIKNLLSANTQLSISRNVANRMTELATKDTLTGIRNKTAYDYEIKTLDRQLEEGGLEFGIAMIDLNFLKHTNDTYGHENGNAALIRLSRIICGIFAHSPVFRIGGDEFAVILMKSDYGNITELEEEFNNVVSAAYRDASLDPWLRISAALGYAMYDPETDTCVTDVFNRADRIMYEHKRQMKDGGVVPITE